MHEKVMTIEEKVKYHIENFTFCKINRQVGSHKFVKTSGYILDYNEEFIVFCEISDFVIQGCRIYNNAQILDIRYSNVEKYFDKMMGWEGIKSLVGLDFNLDISDWQSIFKSLKDNNINVLVENEKPQSDVFTIGPIKKVNKLSCRIRYFDPEGYLDTKPMLIYYENISLVMFRDRYVDTFSKYLRERQ